MKTKHNTPHGGNVARVLGAVAVAVAALWIAPPSAQATDPIPDLTAIICPVLMPKSGHPMQPTDITDSWIREAYAQHWETWWKEASHWMCDSNGVSTHGMYFATKTPGFIHLPWPLGSPVSPNLTGYLAKAPSSYVKFDPVTVTFPWRRWARGIGEEVVQIDPITGEPVQLYGGEGPLLDYDVNGDPVWTPGEAFKDRNGNGVWDDTVKDEDRWIASNKTAISWQPVVGPPTFFGEFRSVLPASEWDDRRGEIFADYFPNTVFDAASGIISYCGYDPVVTLAYVRRNESSNVFVTVSELDLTPFDGKASWEGDMYHTYVSNGIPGDAADTPTNHCFDFNVRADTLQPLVYRAIKQGTATNPVTITYDVYIDPGNGAPYVGTDPVSAGAIKTRITVNLFQAAELFGKYEPDFNGTSWTNFNMRLYVDTVNSKVGAWDRGKPAEPFEDFLSWWAGGFTYVLGGIPGAIDHDGAVIGYDLLGNPIPAGREGRSDRTADITWAEYQAYINWNYPGDTVSLIARAGNGVYDGPDGWIEKCNNKYRQNGGLDPQLFEALEPAFLATPWKTWYMNFFGSTNVDWPVYMGSGVIPAVVEENPGTNIVVTTTVTSNMVAGVGMVVTTNSFGSWMPAIGESWAYDSSREFADLPSSIHHNHLPSTYPVKTSYLDASSPMHWAGGDGRLGEITSPQDDSIFGKDNGKHNPYKADTFDYKYVSAGPFAWNIHGINGWDAGNLLTLEVLTRRVDACGNHPWDLRDTNLDGMIDQGETRNGYASYTVDDDTMTVDNGIGDVDSFSSRYPFNRVRVIEECVEAYDQIQNYNDIMGYPYVVALHYPGGGGFKHVSGLGISVLTADSPTVLWDAGGQICSLGGGSEGGAGEGGIVTNRPDPKLDGGFGQALIAHEISHDLGCNDYYDYDSWNGIIENYPVGAYDLMSRAGLVHGIPATTVIERHTVTPWASAQDLRTLLTYNGGPQTIAIYPNEWNTNGYFVFDRIGGSTGESLWFWYIAGDSVYDPVGGKGIYICHALGGGPGQYPAQQRLGEHFAWEMLEADGNGELIDGVNTGDTGDPFPGTSGKYMFTADSNPNSRWWDRTDSGLRILNIVLPADGSHGPALVTFEWYNPDIPPGVYYGAEGADTDGDGIPDWWEISYFNSLTIANATSDFDRDGLTDLEEFLCRTNPKSPAGSDSADALDDADHDGLSNGDEVHVFHTDPFKADTDDDSYSDFVEVNNRLPDPADNYGQHRALTSPLDSTSPHIPRSLVMAGRTVEAPYGSRMGFIPDPDKVIIGPTVTITAPADGSSVNVRYTTLTGSYSSSVPISRVRIYNTGVLVKQLTAGTTNGTFSETLIIRAGLNILKVEVRDTEGQVGSSSVTVNGNFAAADIRVTQTWSVPGDLDTWLVDPVGRHRGWTSSGPGLPANVAQQIPGSFLDIDDIPGTGPENITVERGHATNGNYEVWMNNYANSGSADSTVRILVHESEASEQYVEFGPTPMPTADNNGSNSNAWWHVTTIQWPSGTMTPGGRPVQVSVPETREEATTAGLGWTIEGWVMPTDGNQSGAICAYVCTNVTPNVNAYVIGLSSNRPFVRVTTKSGVVYDAWAAAIEPNVWTHLACVFSESERSVRIHVNGSLVVAQQMLEDMIRRPGRFLVDTGYSPTGTTTNYLTGCYLDELRVWDRDRGGGLISENMYEAVAPGVTLLAYYRFDDGGTGIEDFTHSSDRSYDLGTVWRLPPVLLPDVLTDAKPGPDGLWGTADDVPAGAGADGHNDYVTARVYAPVSGLLDSDGDGLPNWWENIFFNGAANPGDDSDTDGLKNLYEYYVQTNPKSRDSDNDGVLDALEDFDHDGLANLKEQQTGADPRLADTDDDGILDLDEVTAGTDPANPLSPLVDRVLQVDGTATSYVQMPADIKFMLTDWTIQAWIKPAALQNGVVIGRTVEAGVTNFVLGITGSGRVFSGYTGNDGASQVVLTSPATHVVQVGEWTHVASTFDSTTHKMTVYMDGVDVASAFSSVSPARDGRGPVRCLAGQGFNGLIDEVALFDLVRSPADVAASMEGLSLHTNANLTGILAYYRFEDGTSATNSGSGRWQSTSANLGWNWGQVQDFSSTDSEPWLRAWLRSGTLYGNAIMTAAPADAPVLVSREDWDGDGLPNYWELQYNLDPYTSTDQNGAFGDPDGDGLNNLAEFRAGSNPIDWDSNRNGLWDYDDRPTPASRTYGEIYTDGDEMDDGWEVKYPDVLSPHLFDAQVDPDFDGWDNLSEFMAGTRPNDRTNTPSPQVAFSVRYDGQRRGGKTMLFAYADSSMGGAPAAVFDAGIMPVTTVPGELVDLAITNAVSGRLQQGNMWFLAFIDNNGNRILDEGEPAGMPQEQPISVGWDAVHVTVGLSDYRAGFGRFSWAANPAKSSYTIVIRRLNSTGQPIVLTKVIQAPRTFFHEGDFINAGLASGLPAAGLLHPSFEWLVDDVHGGTISNSWNATVEAPTLLFPMGNVLVLAQNEFVWQSDGINTMFEIQISSGSPGGAVVFDRVIPSPYRDSSGQHRYVLPIYAGDTSMPAGVYYWRVRAKTPNLTGPWQAAAGKNEGVFSVDVTPQHDGSYSIAGNAMYFGRVTPSRIVLQAYDSRGFSGMPVSQQILSGTGAYEIRGLRAGTWSILAFIDQNGNSALDPGETYGVVKDAVTPYSQTYKPASIATPPSATHRNVVLRDQDTDNDKLPDAWEVEYFGDIGSAGPGTVYSSPPYTDQDGDGVNDWEEYQLGSSPSNPDSDGDGLTDGQEFLLYHSNPAKADSDGDGLNDGQEVTLGLNPNSSVDDSSGVPTNLKLLWDGVAGYDLANDLIPGKADSDNDGVSDLMEIAAGSDPLDPNDTRVVAITGVRFDGLGRPVVEWEAGANARQWKVLYTMEYTQNLKQWTAMGTWVSQGTGAVVAVGITDTTEHTGAGTGFYRLKLSLLE